jgi:chain length determinant protein EpsF
MNFKQFITILLARKRVILRVFACVVVTTFVLSLVVPKHYKAIAYVVVDFKNPDPINGVLGAAMVMPSYMATQVDLIASERVARRVVKMLGFEKVPELVAQWKDDTNGGDTSFEGYYAYELGKHLDVVPSDESNVISIKFTAPDPKTAAAVANAFAQAYLDTNVELQIEPAKQFTDYFVARTKEIQDTMDKEQAALSAYQKDKGIVSVDERLDVETARLNDLSGQLTILEAQKSEAQSRQHLATGALESNPDVMNNPVIQNLQTTISASEGKLQEASNTLGVNHPQVKEQKAELESLKTRLKAEMANVASSLGTNAQVFSQKEAEIRSELEDQKKRVLDLKKQRDEANVMTQELTSTQLDYNNVRQRLSQSSLQSQSQQTSASIMTPAYEPDPGKPSWPKLWLNLILSVFLGGMMGVGVALLMEQMDRYIRSEEDLSGLGIPVLGILTVERTSSKSRWQFWHRQKALT